MNIRSLQLVEVIGATAHHPGHQPTSLGKPGILLTLVCERPDLLNTGSPSTIARHISSRGTRRPTKMNWIVTQFDGAEPITILAARQVGSILRYVAEGDPIEHRIRSLYELVGGFSYVLSATYDPDDHSLMKRSTELLATEVVPRLKDLSLAEATAWPSPAVLPVRRCLYRRCHERPACGPPITAKVLEAGGVLKV